MADYNAALRSNPFRVKDKEAFANWVEETIGGALEIDFVRDSPDEVVILGYSDLPTSDYEGEEIDFAASLAAHLKPGSVAVIFGSGHEKLRFIGGWAIAIHPTGETVETNLNDIYRDAQEAFSDDEIQEAF